jgi:acetyl esterase/lipase
VLLNPVVNLATPVFYKFLDSSLLGPGVKLPDTATLAAKYTQKARALSPLYSLRKPLAPILLINGLDDKITPAVDAQSFADSARRYGTAVELQWLKETGHAFAVPHYKASEAQVVQTALAMDAWLVKAGFLQGKPTLVHGADPNWIKR